MEMLPLLEEEARKRQGTRTDIKEKIPESEYSKATEQAAQIPNTNHHYVSDAKALKADR